MSKPRLRHLRRADYSTTSEERQMLILDVLRKSVIPLTRMEITAALGWPENILNHNINKSIDPLILLMAEGKVGSIKGRPFYRYYADPDISEMITKRQD